MKCILTGGFTFDIDTITEINSMSNDNILVINSADKNISLSILEKELNKSEAVGIIKVVNEDKYTTTIHHGFTIIKSIIFKNTKYSIGYEIQLIRLDSYKGSTDVEIQDDIIIE